MICLGLLYELSEIVAPGNNLHCKLSTLNPNEPEIDRDDRLLYLRTTFFTVDEMSVRVIARIRPLLKAEVDKNTIVSAISTDSESSAPPTVVRIPNPKNESEDFSFQFNSVYGQDATQQDIFDGEGTQFQCQVLIIAGRK